MRRRRTPDERELDRAQRAVTAGRLADETRKRLIVDLHLSGMSQRDIAELLSRASIAAGGLAIGEDAVSHLVRRYRERQEQDPP